MANAHTTSNAPTSITHFLRGISFPAEKDDLVSTAEHNGADNAILEKLDNLPAGDFSTMADVMKAYGSEIDQQGDEDINETVYQTTPAEAYSDDLSHRPVDLSNRQDRSWSGNTGSKEKLERNGTGNTPETTRTSAPTDPVTRGGDMADDTTIGKFEDLSGAKTQGQGYELAGGKGTNDSSLSDETSDEKADYLARRPM